MSGGIRGINELCVSTNVEKYTNRNSFAQYGEYLRLKTNCGPSVAGEYIQGLDKNVIGILYSDEVNAKAKAEIFSNFVSIEVMKDIVNNRDKSALTNIMNRDEYSVDSIIKLINDGHLIATVPNLYHPVFGDVLFGMSDCQKIADILAGISDKLLPSYFQIAGYKLIAKYNTTYFEQEVSMFKKVFNANESILPRMERLTEKLDDNCGYVGFFALGSTHPDKTKSKIYMDNFSKWIRYNEEHQYDHLKSGVLIRDAAHQEVERKDREARIMEGLL